MIRIHSLARVLPLVALTVLSTACRDDRKETPVGPVDPKPETSVGTVAYLTISDSAPAAGSTVTVTAFANGTNVSFGSFAAHLTFDAEGLAYLSESSSGAGMRAVNPQLGDVAVAGVNLEGFAEGELFAVQLKVVNPKAVASLALSMSELTTVSYRNEKATLSVQKPVRFKRAQLPSVE